MIKGFVSFSLKKSMTSSKSSLYILLVKHVKFKQAATDIYFLSDLVYSLHHILPFGGWTMDGSCLPCGPHFFAFPAMFYFPLTLFNNSFDIYSLHMSKELNSIFLTYLLRKPVILYHYLLFHTS